MIRYSKQLVNHNVFTNHNKLGSCRALAEFERNLIIERTNAGLSAARARGRKGGRPLALTPDRRNLVIKLYEEKKHTIDQICQMMGISKPTLYKYVAAGKDVNS